MCPKRENNGGWTKQNLVLKMKPAYHRQAVKRQI
jgi:hypothetical protein